MSTMGFFLYFFLLSRMFDLCLNTYIIAYQLFENNSWGNSVYQRVI